VSRADVDPNPQPRGRFDSWWAKLALYGWLVDLHVWLAASLYLGLTGSETSDPALGKTERVLLLSKSLNSWRYIDPVAAQVYAAVEWVACGGFALLVATVMLVKLVEAIRRGPP
jgi:hypothetical protein